MDAMVLKAQQWANTTYGAVPGYVRCPENGQTGWSTMYSLTRGLQHELGLTALSDAFGPATTAAMDAHGPIDGDEPNKNFVKLIQAACFCKGYHAGDIDGKWGNKALSARCPDYAVWQMMYDLGLRDFFNGSVNTRLFKALLTMDAYVLVSGGDEQVREIQQWFNQNYWQRSWFSIVPCDGHYSRDIQKALMKVLQFNFGVAESTITGNFGPATKDGLRAHQLAPGASGIFVQLLSAACVFNGPVVEQNGTQTRTVFKTSFDGLLGQYLSAFQRFSRLTVNGSADFATWCQLLVSMGDADRPATASDTRFTITLPMAQAMKAAGYQVVGRYLDEEASSTLDKEIKPGELDAIFTGGLRMFPIWQYNSRRLEDFSYAAGVTHAGLAHDRMVHYGFSPGPVIYFAVDYDATDDDIDARIIPYFRGVQAGLVAKGRKYLAGVYGSRNVCIRASNEAQVASSFVSGMSWGFSGNLGFPLPYNWAFNQIQEIRFASSAQTIDLDRDVHRKEMDPGVGRGGVGNDAATSLTNMLDFVDQVHALAVEYGGDPNLRMMEFLRAPRYTQQYKGWDILLGAWDQAWIDFAEARIPRLTTYRDPSFLESINIDHLAATANAVYLKGSGTGTGANRGDFGGWGGDITTFYAEWRNQEDSWPSGYNFCMDRLAKRGIVSSYGFGDMVEDVDGYLIGTACTAGASFHTELRRHLGTASQATRFAQFWQQRFGSSTTNAVAIARTMLLDVGADDTLDDLRDLAIISATGPFHMPVKLDPARFQRFLEGFADTLMNLAVTG